MTDPTPIPDAELAELERLREAATPGPWTHDPESAEIWSPAALSNVVTQWAGDGARAGVHENADGTLIVAAVNALPGLIRTVREQRAEIGQQDAALRSASAIISDISEVVKSGSLGKSLVDDVRCAVESRDAEIARLRAQVETARKHVDDALADLGDRLGMFGVESLLEAALAALDGKETDRG